MRIKYVTMQVSIATTLAIYCAILVCSVQAAQKKDFFSTPCVAKSPISQKMCLTVHPMSRCEGNGTAYMCACDQSKGFFKYNNECVLHNHVHEECFDKNSLCVDGNSACTYDGSNTNRKRCSCKDGYITVYNETTARYLCGKELAGDKECDECIKNEGRCYDLDGDNKKDGCQCVMSRSGPDCQNLHVTVQCSAEEKTICYGPPNKGVDYSKGSSVFTENSKGKKLCTGTLVTNSTVNKRCAVGMVQLVLPLATGQRRCSTHGVPAQHGFERLETIVAIQRADTDGLYQFMTYCAMQRHKRVYVGGVSVSKQTKEETLAAGNEEGINHYAKLDLQILNRMYEDVSKNPTFRNGEKVMFFIQGKEKAIYPAMKVTSAMFSSKAGTVHSANNGPMTRQVVVNGCAAKEPFNQNNNWHKMQDDPAYLGTGLVKLQKFGSSSLLVLHATIQLCTADDTDPCKPTNCTDPSSYQGFGRRRKRAVVNKPEEEVIEIQIKIRDEDDKSEKDTESKVGGVSLLHFILLVIFVCIILLIFGVITFFLLWKVRNKRTKVVDYAPEKSQAVEMPRLQRNTMRI